VAGITFAVYQYRREKYLMVGWLGFLGTMVPVIGIVQAGEQGMADRYAYMPFVGLFIAGVWGCAELAERLRIHKAYAAVTLACVLGAFVAITHQQIGYWKDTYTLWTHTLSITQENYVAEASLGAELISEGKIEEAATHLRAGMAINPRDPFSHLDLGVCEKRLGRLDEAINQYQIALRLTSGVMLKTAAYGNLGSTYAALGDYPSAIQNYEMALQARPDDFASLIGLGVISQKTGKTEAAVDYYSRAVKVQVSDVDLLLMSQAMARAGRQKDAQLAFARAQLMSHDWSATIAAVNRLLQN
jgi:tetratricopeptide (TPR) repeat protein